MSLRAGLSTGLPLPLSISATPSASVSGSGSGSAFTPLQPHAESEAHQTSLRLENLRRWTTQIQAEVHTLEQRLQRREPGQDAARVGPAPGHVPLLGTSSSRGAAAARAAATAPSSASGSAARGALGPLLPTGLSGGFQALCQQRDSARLTSKLNFACNQTRDPAHLCKPPALDAQRQTLVPSCGTCMKDGDKTLAISWLRELSDPGLRSLNLFCHVHTMMGMSDLGAKLQEKKHKHTIMAMFQRVVESLQRPSQHKELAQQFVSWIRDDLGEGDYATALETKLEHMPLTTRTCAALGYDQGGIPTHDNATERGNATAHAATNKKRGGFSATLQKISTFVAADSLLDHAFADSLRADVWGVQAIKTMQAMESTRVYPCTDRCKKGCVANCAVVINPVACGIEMELALEELNPTFRQVPAGTPAKDAVWDLEKHLLAKKRKVLLVPTATTIRSILDSLPARRMTGQTVDEQFIQQILQEICSDGMPSWVDTFTLLMTLTLEEFMGGTFFGLDDPKPMTLSDVADWMVTFAIMTNEQDPAIVERILSKYERGVPARTSGAYTNGATVDRKLAAELGVWLCRCPGKLLMNVWVQRAANASLPMGRVIPLPADSSELYLADFLKRTSCLHVVLKMIRDGTIKLPRDFETTQVASRGGRPVNFVSGTGRLCEAAASSSGRGRRQDSAATNLQETEKLLATVNIQAGAASGSRADRRVGLADTLTAHTPNAPYRGQRLTKSALQAKISQKRGRGISKRRPHDAEKTRTGKGGASAPSKTQPKLTSRKPATADTSTARTNAVTAHGSQTCRVMSRREQKQPADNSLVQEGADASYAPAPAPAPTAASTSRTTTAAAASVGRRAEKQSALESSGPGPAKRLRSAAPAGVNVDWEEGTAARLWELSATGEQVALLGQPWASEVQVSSSWRPWLMRE